MNVSTTARRQALVSMISLGSWLLAYQQGKQLGQGAANEIRENIRRATEFRERGSIALVDLLRVLSDHAEPPTESICRHGDGDSAARTIAATFVCPEDRVVWTTLGPPCLEIQAVGTPGS